MQNLVTKGLLCLCLISSQTNIFSQKHSTCATADLLLIDTNCNEIPNGPGANSGDPTGYDDTDGSACGSGSSQGDDYIYVYTATHKLSLKLELWGTDYCNVLVTSGCPIGGTCIALSQTYISSYQSLVTPVLIIGEDYYIHISSLDDEASAGQFCMNAELVEPAETPANDECNLATPLIIVSELDCSNPTPGTLELATASPEDDDECPFVNEDDDVWFSFIATAESHTIQLLNLENLNGSQNMKHSLWEGNCGSLTLANECPFSLYSVQNNLVIGNTYYIRVCTQFEGPTTINFDICVSTLPSPPANDECSTAYEAFANPNHPACYSIYRVYGTIGGATASAEDSISCEGDEDDDIWFYFVATSTKHTIFDFPDFVNFTGYFTISIWEGECGALTLVECYETSPTQLIDLTIGSTYYIRFYSEDSTPSITGFEVCIATPSTTVDNDVCSNAITLEIPEASICQESIILTNINISENAGEEALCDGTQDFGMWYEFEAPANGAFNFESINGLPGIAIYEGTDCSNLSPVQNACIDNHKVGGTISNLTPGNTYYAMIWTDKTFSAVLEFCVYSSVCIAPTYTATVDESACPNISITVDITDLGSASSVDIIPDIGPDSFIGVGVGVYTLYGYDVGVEDIINVTVSDYSVTSCGIATNLQNAEICVPDCGVSQQIGCGQNVNTGNLNGVGEWAVFNCNTNTPTFEKVYRFFPTEDGDYTLHVENIAGTGWINYFYRTDAVCESTDWICLGEVYSTTTDFVIPNLLAGDEVYILIDGQNFYDGRIQNFRIDCGIADCALSATRIYVNSGANGDNTGCSWEHAFPTLQMAFEAMELNASIAEIWVRKGTYYPDYGNDRFGSFKIDQTISIYGGFVGNETDINQRDIPNNPTTISGNIADPEESNDNSYHIFTIESNANQVVIDGFNITSGMADGIAIDHKTGAGVLCYGNAELINCIISQCESISEGSAMRLDGSIILTCDDVTTTGNTSGGNGSAVSIHQNSQLNVKGVVSLKE